MADTYYCRNETNGFEMVMRKVDLTFDIGIDFGVILSLRTKVTSLYQEMQI